MTWWIAFIIAVLGWYFTSNQNAKNSIRSLINQEVKEAREKLQQIIVSCSDGDCELPLKPDSADFIKMQTYILAVYELERLYASYRTPFYSRVKAVNFFILRVSMLFETGMLSKVKDFFKKWFLAEKYETYINQSSVEKLTEHTANIRKSLTSDDGFTKKEDRIAKLNLEYRNFCILYKFVS